ncbi:hypothetical protein HWV62_32904 [Athelia sp. TMB]|nr:hypothetical protein HWV62_32904 [Athelia sp. TMB]
MDTRAGAVLAANTSNALIPQISCTAKRISTQVVRCEGSRPALPLADVLRLLWHLAQGRERQRGAQPAGRRAPRPSSNALAAEFGVEDMGAQLYLGFPTSARVRAQAPRHGASSSSAATCAWRGLHLNGITQSGVIPRRCAESSLGWLKRRKMLTLWE